MPTYVILSQIAPTAFQDPDDFKQISERVSTKIKEECPGVNWRHSYATMGQYDVVDIVDSEDPMEVEKAAMIIRAYGQSRTETMLATPWREFLEKL